MRLAVARDHEPCSTAPDVLPQLAMYTGGIVAQVDIVDPALPRRLVEGLVRVAVWPFDGRITQVDELLVPARSTVATVDPHRLTFSADWVALPRPFRRSSGPWQNDRGGMRR